MITLTADTPMVDRRRALLAAILDRGPERFDMENWFTGPDLVLEGEQHQIAEFGTLDEQFLRVRDDLYASCGTACCIAGTGAMIAPAPEYYPCYVSSYVADYFDLPLASFYTYRWFTVPEIDRIVAGLIDDTESASELEPEEQFHVVTTWLAELIDNESGDAQ